MSRIIRQCNTIIAKYGKLFGCAIIILSPISLLIQWIVSRYYVRRGKTNRYVLFESYPNMSDNALILFDYFLQNNILADCKKIWFVTKSTQKKIKYKGHDVFFVQRFSKFGIISVGAIKAILTAKYVLSTHGISFPIKKRIDSQIYILLWHGCGYNGVSHYDVDWKFDKALVPGKLFVKVKSDFWNTTPEHILAIGYPRYDWMLHPSDKTKKIFDKIKMTRKKCILWMPTFRKNNIGIDFKEGVISNYPLIRNQREWTALDKLCKNLDILLIIKCHVLQVDYGIDFCNYSNIIQINEDFFTKYQIPKYEFIALTDGLISDYSSVAIDYLIVDNPLAYTLDDYELYKNTRGFVFDNPLEYMPGHHLYSFEDLKKYLNDVSNNKDIYRDARHRVRKIAIHESTCYCKDFVDYLLKK